jgi:multiple sugar transport system permease protein
MGYASALAWLLFILLFVFTLLQFRMSDRWVYYAGERTR